MSKLGSSEVILVTGDLHWNDRARDEYRHKYVDTMVSIIKRENVEAFFILGDLTDEKDRHTADLVTKVFDHIYLLASHCHVVILRGNHDYLSPSTPFFGCLARLDGVTWINEPTVLTLDDEYLFLPHTHRYQDDWAQHHLKDYRLIFTHNTFAGAKVESGQVLDGIPRSVFSTKQRVISGDIHVPQKLGPIEYVGSPYPIDFGDSPHRHMMLINKDVHSYIEYDGPRKIVLDIDMNWDFDLSDFRVGDIVKFCVYLKPDESYTQFQQYKEVLYLNLQDSGLIVHMVQPIMDTIGPVRRRQMQKRSDTQVMQDFAIASGIKESTLKTGLRLMRKN